MENDWEDCEAFEAKMQISDWSIVKPWNYVKIRKAYSLAPIHRDKKILVYIYVPVSKMVASAEMV